MRYIVKPVDCEQFTEAVCQLGQGTYAAGRALLNEPPRLSQP
jgi:hypothetical protein